MVSQALVPLEPPEGLGDASLELAWFWSPKGFPWHLSLVRLDWCRPGASANSDPPKQGGVAARAHPCLLLVPFPWSMPEGDIAEAYRRWERSLGVQGSPQKLAPLRHAGWRLADENPITVSSAWRATTDALASVQRHIDRPARTRHAALKRVIEESPWMLSLSDALLRLAAAELDLPTHLYAGTTLALAQGRGRRNGWLGGAPERSTRSASMQWRNAGAHLRLVVEDLPSLKAGAFVAGVTDPLRVGELHDPVRHTGRWLEELERGHVHAMLVPLLQEGASNLELIDDFDGWASSWLLDRRAQRALWSVFGRTVLNLQWNSDQQQPLEAFEPFVYGRWAPTIEGDSGLDHAGARLVWALAERP